MKKGDRGFVLPIVIAIILVIGLLLPALISWIQQDTKQSVKDAKSTLAFNLAEAGVDRGMWKLKSSTSTFTQARVGSPPIAGYNFDSTYPDVPGGYYRIKFTSGPGPRDVTVTSEGKDLGSNERRAIQAVFRNQTFGGAMISGGVVTWANDFSAHWGPIMAQGNINITDSGAAKDYFPRKFSGQTVQCTVSGYPRDQNGLALPNTDNTEWWSDYAVPELPLLDFSALKSSASATGTLNIYGCSHTMAKRWGGSSSWPTTCNGPSASKAKHFQNSWNHPLARNNYVWYWDGDVIVTGDVGTAGSGIWGTFIVRGNFTNYAGDNYSYTGPVPANAWQEYSKITKTAVDTSAKNEYPADDGFHKSRATFNFGGETWTGGTNPPPTGNTDVGYRGLVYVGLNMDLEGPADMNGVVWVGGNVSRGASVTDQTLVFYDDSLDLPTLNVVLIRQSWKEVPPSSTSWP